jgi:hypothetical protein
MMPAHRASDVARASHGRWWQQSPVTRESSKETVKTIAQGMPGGPGEPVVTNSRVFYHHARLRVQRAPGIPRALSLRVAPGALFSRVARALLRAKRLPHSPDARRRGKREGMRARADTEPVRQSLCRLNRVRSINVTSRRRGSDVDVSKQCRCRDARCTITTAAEKTRESSPELES